MKNPQEDEPIERRDIDYLNSYITMQVKCIAVPKTVLQWSLQRYQLQTEHLEHSGLKNDRLGTIRSLCEVLAKAIKVSISDRHTKNRFTLYLFRAMFSFKKEEMLHWLIMLEDKYQRCLSATFPAY